MAAFDIFDDPQQAANVPMAGGAPTALYSGNPWATALNLAAQTNYNQGAFVGGALSDAVQGALGQAPVDPMSIQMSRADAYARLYQEEIDAGIMPGQAQVNAAKKAREAGVIDGREFLELTSEGVGRRDEDRKFLGEAIDNVNKSKNISDFRQIKANFMAMVELAQQQPNRVSDYMFVVNMLKATDPTSVNSQNEIIASSKAIMGKRNVAALLGALGFGMENFASFVANKGRPETFSATQKEAAIRALGTLVNQRAEAAFSDYNSQKNRFVQLGGNVMPFELGTMESFNDFAEFDANTIADENAGAFTDGNARPFAENVARAVPMLNERGPGSVVDNTQNMVSSVFQMGAELAVEEGLNTANIVGGALIDPFKKALSPKLQQLIEWKDAWLKSLEQ